MTTPAHHEPHELSTPQKVYLWLTCISVACLLVADITGCKLFTIPLGFSFSVPWSDQPIDAIQHTSGMLAFPITFLLTDLINEYYGKKAARRVVWISFAMGFLVFLFINAALNMEHLDAVYNVKKESFDNVLGNTRIMYVASICAFLVGSFSDIFLFSWIKKLTKGKQVWLRATGSTIISQFIDSLIVTYLAFNLGRRLFPAADSIPMPMPEVLKTALTGYMLKYVIAITLTPAIYLGRHILHTYFGLKALPPDQATT
ncbi:MAG: queuosine precursor transporter [Phycisphaerales bacterium]|nr:MAG: queuosine precursor transporter [Phycisphaerales bacterium]